MLKLLLGLMLLTSGCSHFARPNEYAGITERHWYAQGKNYTLTITTMNGGETEGSAVVEIDSDHFKIELGITREAKTLSHEIRARIEQTLAEQGKTLNSTELDALGKVIEQVVDGAKDSAKPKSP